METTLKRTWLLWLKLSGSALLGTQCIASSGAIPVDRKLPTIVAITPADLKGKAMSVLDSSSPTAELLSGSGSHYLEISRYRSDDRRFETSIKRFERITLGLKNWPIDEFMHLLKGSVVLTEASGHSHTYTAGDSFVIPKGFNGEWKQLDTVEMVTVTYSAN